MDTSKLATAGAGLALGVIATKMLGGKKKQTSSTKRKTTAKRKPTTKRKTARRK